MPQVLRVGFGPFGIAGPAGDDRDPDDAGDARRAGERELHGGDAPADGGRMGSPAAAVVQPAARHAISTPVNSILLVGAVLVRRSRSLSLIGVGQAEAFQLLFNAGGMFYALTYVVMFAIPLFGLRGVTPRPPLWLRVASLSGLLMTLLYVALSVFPIIKVASVATFALKIATLIVMANLVGVGILVAARRRAQVPSGTWSRDVVAPARWSLSSGGIGDCAVAAGRPPASLAGEWDVYIALSARPQTGFEGWRRMGFAHFAGSDSGKRGLAPPPHRPADAQRHQRLRQRRLGAPDPGRPRDHARGLARRHPHRRAVRRRPADGSPLSPGPPVGAGRGGAGLPGVEDAGFRLAVRRHGRHARLHDDARRREARELHRAARGQRAVRRRHAAHAVSRAFYHPAPDASGRRAATSSSRSTCAAATSRTATTSATTTPTSSDGYDAVEWAAQLPGRERQRRH